MAEVQPFRLRKVQQNIGIWRKKLTSIFFQRAECAYGKKHIECASRDSSFWRSFCLLTKNILAFNTRLFQCSRIPIHCIISLVHIICQVSAQSWRVEINRFHSTFESFWGRGWCYTNVSFCILTQTFRIKTGLHIQRIYTRTFNISENDARPLLISYNNFIPVFYYFCKLKFFYNIF